MIGELVEDLFHTDHRVWRTLVPLLVKPGLLTKEYLRGKRVTYTPPFRLYIVLSLIFFLTASLSDTHVAVKPLTLQDGASETTPGATASTTMDAEAEQKLEEMLARIPEDKRAAARDGMREVLQGVPVEQQRNVVAGMTNPCSPENLGSALPDSLDSGQKQRLLQACRTISADKGERFSEELWHRVPQMMFFFLPLIALFTKLLYLGSRRYYAEHLLFFVHFHAFFFLAMTLNNVIGWSFGWFEGAWAGFIAGLFTTVLVFYTPAYLYLAMRRVYGQGKFVTSVKFLLLTGAYFFSLLLTLFGLVIFTALTLK